MMLAISRVIGAAVASPLALAVLWSLPAAGTPAFFPLLRLNAVVCFALFLLCAGLSHPILRWKRWTRLREYAGVMFVVASIVLAITQMTLLQWTFGNGGSEYHLRTQVIEQGHFTPAGVLLTLLEAVFGAIWLTAAFALFWVLAVPRRTHDA